jgi:hypothetical protein
MTSSNNDELAMQPAAHKTSNLPLHQVLCVLLLPLLPSGSSSTLQIAEAAHYEDALIDFAPCMSSVVDLVPFSQLPAGNI